MLKSHLHFCFSGQRLEDFVYKKMDKEKPPRLNNNELLGNYMITAGNEFGPGASYGKRDVYSLCTVMYILGSENSTSAET